MLLVIDNYDSFTYNLVQYFGELGQKVVVYRNDEIDIAGIDKLKPQYLVISPGPCTPLEAGISMAAVKHFAGKIPIFGVCLGFQAIIMAFGGKIIGAKKIMHGKISKIYHNKQGVFAGIDDPFNATRYHSLVADKSSLPDCFTLTAQTNDNNEIEEIMGIKHKNLAVEGVQFHPESIMTDFGHTMLNNFLQQNKEI